MVEKEYFIHFNRERQRAKMAKKSFFERLTGATKEELFESYSEEKIAPKKVKLENSPKTKKSKKSIQKPSPEWPSDEEGELMIDVYQTENDIVIKSTIAGASSKDIEVSITNDMITIRGTRQRDETVPQEKYYYQELYWGPFSRSIILPVDVNADKAKASIKDGILTVRLPKIEKLKTKTIQVKEIE